MVIRARAQGESDQMDESGDAPPASPAIDCPELERCLGCTTDGCPFGELVMRIIENHDPVSYLDALPKTAKNEVVKRSRVCLEQGYCGLHCISRCAIGKCLERFAEGTG